MRLGEELGVRQDGRRTDRAEGCLATSVWLMVQHRGHTDPSILETEVGGVGIGG